MIRLRGDHRPAERRPAEWQLRLAALLDWSRTVGVLVLFFLIAACAMLVGFAEDFGIPGGVKWALLGLQCAMIVLIVSLNVFRNKIAEHCALDFSRYAGTPADGSWAASDCDGDGGGGDACGDGGD